MNINTKEYWDRRFSSGDWACRRGALQTRRFAQEQLGRLGMNSTFSGTFVDFGCGCGDAFPVYRRYLPNAKLVGVDHSVSAIEICKAAYGELAEFVAGSVEAVPVADVILASNVFEHLSNDADIARALLLKCQKLYVVVPYEEKLTGAADSEHVNSYTIDSFPGLPRIAQAKIYPSNGYSMMGRSELCTQYAKNLARILLGRPLFFRNKQIMFGFGSKVNQ